MLMVGVAYGKNFSGWEPAVNAESVPGTSTELNTAFQDGCPIQAPDGLSLFMASTRPGGLGGIDIWVAQRASTDDGWGTPTNVGTPINSTADDFCPTPVNGNGLFFVSTRTGGCGGPDMYFARRNPHHGWSAPANLGCASAGGPNTAGAEFSPSYFEAGGQGFLYFSSGPDIYVSQRLSDGSFGVGTPVTELNSAAADLRPNVRKDGLEIVFDSDRQGPTGNQDIYSASRSSINDPWSVPVNLGSNVNTSAVESRASLSWDGETMYFGSSRPGIEGVSDIFVTTRDKVTGRN